MVLEIDGINIYYELNIGEGVPIVILHGWGASTVAMKGIFNFLTAQNKTVYSIDFPGFGYSSEPPPYWGTQQYAKIIDDFISLLKIDSPIVIGHSFGGRVAIILASQKLVSKLILVDSAGVKPKFSLKKKLKIWVYKIKKKLKLNTVGSGSSDYKNLSSNMKSVFVKVVNTHLNKYLKNIQVPTLLIWGKDDKETPLYMAKKINKLISGSGLVILNNCGHFCFADNYVAFCKIISAFY